MMDEYVNKSFEELRFEDYCSSNPFLQACGTQPFGQFRQFSTNSFAFGSSNGHPLVINLMITADPNQLVFANNFSHFPATLRVNSSQADNSRTLAPTANTLTIEPPSESLCKDSNQKKPSTESDIFGNLLKESNQKPKPTSNPCTWVFGTPPKFNFSPPISATSASNDQEDSDLESYEVIVID